MFPFPTASKPVNRYVLYLLPITFPFAWDTASRLTLKLFRFALMFGDCNHFLNPCNSTENHSHLIYFYKREGKVIPVLKFLTLALV
jgi:hypothetical protein